MAKFDYPIDDDADVQGGGAIFWSGLCQRKFGGRLAWMVLVQCPDGNHPPRWVLASRAIKADFDTRDRACYHDHHPQRNTKDKKSLASETVTLFSLEDGRGVPVFAADCQHIWFTTRTNATNNWDIYIEVCPTCQRNPRAYRDRLKQLGRAEAGDPTQEDLLEDVRAVISDWRSVRNMGRPLPEQYKQVTQARVAALLGLDGVGTTTGDRKLVARLKRRKVHEMFPHAESWFRAFANTVIEEFEGGADAEDIAQDLIFRLRLCRALAESTQLSGELGNTQLVNLGGDEARAVS